MIEGFDSSGVADVQDAVASLIKTLPGIDELATAPEFEAETVDVPIDTADGAPELADLALAGQLDLPEDPETLDPFLAGLADSGGDVQLPRELTLPNPFRSAP